MKRITADSTFFKKHGLNMYTAGLEYCKHCGKPLMYYTSDENGHAVQPMHLEIERSTKMHYDCYIRFEENLKKELETMEAERDAKFDMDEYTKLHSVPDEVLSKAGEEDNNK